METFPAFDEQQLEYIKRVIDDSDYYILIIGGRYGSVTDDGLSFTEKEYDYAISKRIPILTFVHANPLQIPVGKTDQDADKNTKLDKFIAKVIKSRQRDVWNTPAELSAAVVHSLVYQFRANPGVGWIRGNVAAGTEILTEINDLRKKNEILAAELDDLKRADIPILDDLASLDDNFTFRTKSRGESGKTNINEYVLFWRKIFAIVGPQFLTQTSEQAIAESIVRYVKDELGNKGMYMNLFDADCDTMKLQFIALGYVDSVEGPSTQVGNVLELLVLTDKGRRVLLETKTVRGG
jgi:hypothetical protein